MYSFEFFKHNFSETIRSIELKFSQITEIVMLFQYSERYFKSLIRERNACTNEIHKNAVLSKVGLLPVNCFEGRYFEARSLLLSIFP